MKLCSWLIFSLSLAGALAAEETGALLVDKSQSNVSVAVHATGDSFVGKLENYNVTLSTEPNAQRIHSVTFQFLFADLHTGKADRDKEMLHWENATQFPEGVFTLATLEPQGGNRFTAQGHLRLHGVERPLSFPVTIVAEGHHYTVDGEASVDSRDFGLPIIRKFAVLKVDPVVKVKFHLQAAEKS